MVLCVFPLNALYVKVSPINAGKFLLTICALHLWQPKVCVVMSGYPKTTCRSVSHKEAYFNFD